MSTTNQNSSFPPTEWTNLIQPIKDGSPEAPEALNRLCEIYRAPILLFFRRHGIDAHQAEDLTQVFIASLLRSNIWERLDRANGSFRCFLATRVRWFLLNHWKSLRRPTSQFEPLDDNQQDPNRTPDHEFDRNWAWTLVRQAVSQIEKDWNGRGTGIHFQDLVGFLTTEADHLSIDVLARKYGKSANALYQDIFRLRRTYRTILTSLVRETVSSDAAVKTELSFLVACLK